MDSHVLSECCGSVDENGKGNLRTRFEVKTIVTTFQTVITFSLIIPRVRCLVHTTVLDYQLWLTGPQKHQISIDARIRPAPDVFSVEVTRSLWLSNTDAVRRAQNLGSRSSYYFQCDSSVLFLQNLGENCSFVFPVNSFHIIPQGESYVKND